MVKSVEHYFSSTSSTEHKKQTLDYYINGEKIKLTSSNAVFSKTKVDFGSDLLIKTFLDNNKNIKGDLLDVGCGYGTFGVTFATFYPEINVTMVDVNERAMELASENAEANGVGDRVKVFKSDKLGSVTKKYDYIITNPPIRAGKEVVHAIYEGAAEHLNDGGKIYVVIQKKQGAPSSQEKLESLFGNCMIENKKSGYFILVSERNSK